jgi:lincosamide nucleotidyltransferase A/C/D/E
LATAYLYSQMRNELEGCCQTIVPKKQDLKPEMTAEALVALLQVFEQAGLKVWLDGGWAVDAVVGEQTRPHKDVDIIIRLSDLPKLKDVLKSRGFNVQQGGRESNFVLANGYGLEIDVHAIVFDSAGNGVYRMENGSDWVFPSSGFTGRGLVQGMSVRCLSPETQVLCHAHGYIPTEKDFQDMELLQARFGVELPPQLQRNTAHD